MLEFYKHAGSIHPLTEKLRAIKAKRLWVIIDSCHAEGMATAKDLPADLLSTALPKGVVDALKQGEGRAVFTSSRGNQTSWVRPDNTLSLYTYHLLEALKGAANQPGDRLVTISNVMTHLGKTVEKSARTLRQAEQTPFDKLEAEWQTLEGISNTLRELSGIPGTLQDREAAQMLMDLASALCSGRGVLFFRGYWDEVIRPSEWAHQAAQASSSYSSAGWFASYIAWIHYCRADTNQAAILYQAIDFTFLKDWKRQVNNELSSCL